MSAIGFLLAFIGPISGYLRVLAERAPIAMAQAKRAILQGAAMPLEQGLVLE